VASPPATTLAFADIRVGDRLGGGGNADVFEASARIDGREHNIAIKEPRVEGTIAVEEMTELLEEAELWQSLDAHEHIVGVVDWGETPKPWIAMEYMDGGTLRQRLDTVGPPPIAEAIWIARCLCRAVRHAHRHGVVHLDLKPSNVLFRGTEGETWNVPKIADWGLATHLIEHSGTVEGLSPAYAAPEQVDPDSTAAPDDYTDIYQLGVILYELLTGELPYDATGFALGQRIADPDATPIPPSEREDTLSPAIDAVVLPALAHEKADRYETVVELRNALEALQTDRPFPPAVRSRLDEQPPSQRESATGDADASVDIDTETDVDTDTDADADASTETDVDTETETDAEADISHLPLTDLPGVEADHADALRRNGYRTPQELRTASQRELAAVEGISRALAARIKANIDARDADADVEDSTEQPAETEPERTIHFTNGIADLDDLATVKAAVRSGDIVLGPDLESEVSISKEEVSDELRLLAREVGGDVIRWGDVLVTAPSGMTISREQPFGDGDVHIPPISDMSDVHEIKDTVRDGDICICPLGVDMDLDSNTKEHLIDSLSKVDGDIIQWTSADEYEASETNETIVVTPPGVDIAREPLT
jgi:serine/threonine protein kinase/SepF-like predicted cell division protein (DUF552 family)